MLYPVSFPVIQGSRLFNRKCLAKSRFPTSSGVTSASAIASLSSTASAYAITSLSGMTCAHTMTCARSRPHAAASGGAISLDTRSRPAALSCRTDAKTVKWQRCF